MTLRRCASAVILSALSLALTACGGSSNSTSGTSSPSKQYIYATGVVNNNAVIQSFPIDASGTSVAPSSTTVVGSADIIRSLKTDGNGNLYVLTFQDSNFSQAGVYVYSMSQGSLTLKRSFSTTLTGAGSAMAVDSNGNVYIAIQLGGIDIFPNTTSGLVVAKQSALSGYGCSQIATDSSGYNWCSYAGYVYEFAPAFAGGTYVKMYQLTNGFAETYNDITIGPGNTIYASIYSYLNSFAPQPQVIALPQGSTTVPANQLTGSLTGLTPYDSLAFDRNGTLWVSEGAFTSRTFAKFSTTVGNVAPTISFTSPSSNFGQDQNDGFVIY